MKSVLLLADGTVIHGNGFGAKTTRIGELVFNTSMIGYQESLTDPSYAGQILISTYPMIGNYGINKTDFESDKIHVEGLCTREICEKYEHKDAVKSIDQFLKEFGVPGITGIDTRFLVRHIRSKGVVPAIISTYDGDFDINALQKKLQFDYSSIDFVEKVTTKKPLEFGENKNGKVVLIDYGYKKNIANELVRRGLKVTIVPSFYTSDQIRQYEPNGILLSNGPGDPKILTDAHKVIRNLADKDYPIMAICLGHQLIGHAFGSETFKLKFGHRGCNQPVIDLARKKVVITTQNHGFAVKEVPKGFELTHQNLNDKTNEGMKHTSKPIFSVQYHPEATAGPHDSKYLFDEFVKILK
jgi:carbamoyl-phosphate synthase small subunit